MHEPYRRLSLAYMQAVFCVCVCCTRHKKVVVSGSRVACAGVGTTGSVSISAAITHTQANMELLLPKTATTLVIVTLVCLTVLYVYISELMFSVLQRGCPTKNISHYLFVHHIHIVSRLVSIRTAGTNTVA